MGDLQPITLLAELAERQMAKAQPDLAQIRDTVAKARQQARTAVGSVMNVLAWITGEENPKVMLKEGIDQCIDLLRTDSEVRGVRIARGPYEAPDAIVGRRALRTVAAASIIAAVDMRPAPSEIQVSCGKDARSAVLRIEGRNSQPSREDAMPDDHPLAWDDVDVIAQSAGVEVERRLDPLVVLCRLPIA